MMWPIGGPETSLLNHLTPQNNWEDGRSHFTCGGSLRSRVPILLMSCFDLVCSLPYLKKTDSGVEPVENGQRHGNVRNDRPGPNTEELEVLGAVLSMSLLHDVNHPHGSVSHDEERDELSARFLLLVRLCRTASARTVQHQYRLCCRLYQG